MTQVFRVSDGLPLAASMDEEKDHRELDGLKNRPPPPEAFGGGGARAVDVGRGARRAIGWLRGALQRREPWLRAQELPAMRDAAAAFGGGGGGAPAANDDQILFCALAELERATGAPYGGGGGGATNNGAPERVVVLTADKNLQGKALACGLEASRASAFERHHAQRAAVRRGLRRGARGAEAVAAALQQQGGYGYSWGGR